MHPVNSAPSDEFARLYRNHHGWLVQMLRRRLNGDAENAADLAHDTFERIMRNEPRTPLVEPRGFLTTIAKRLLIDQFRRRAIEQAFLETLMLRDEEFAPSPETQVLVIEALDTVCRMLEKLPPRVRKVFVLAQVEGLPYQSIAHTLNISLQAVQRDITKAWQHCYQVLYT